jgi:hypothetical protein
MEEKEPGLPHPSAQEWPQNWAQGDILVPKAGMQPQMPQGPSM